MATENSSNTASTSRSNSTADSYIGSLISLTSKSEIRYEGVLYNINTEESSIGLKNVRSFGTEGRKKDGPQIPPSDKVYEYILFRGSDIKDLQVKSSPPVLPTPAPVSINNDPAIIQSHYPHPASTSTNLPPAVSGSLNDTGTHNAQIGLPGSNFQGGLPLYQPGGNIGTWGASPPPPSANGSGLAMPMYWQGYYGPPNGLPHLHQQSLLRPPIGLSMPPSMPQPMQYPNYNAPLPTGSNLPGSNLPVSNLPSSNLPASNLPSSNLPASNLPSSNLPASNLPSSNLPASHLPSSNLPASHLPSSNLQASHLPSSNLQASHLPSSNLQASNLPSSNLPASNLPVTLPDIPSPLLSAITSSFNLVSTSLPPSTLPSTLPPVLSASLASETLPSLIPNKTPSSALPAANLSSSLPALSPLIPSGPELNSTLPLISNKPNSISDSAIPYQSSSQPAGSFVPSNSLLAEAPTPSLVTPGQLLKSGPNTVPSPQPVQTAHKDVEVVQVSSKTSTEPSVLDLAITQPPILPLPASARNKLNAHQGYRGRERGRGTGSSRNVTKFTEDFDFIAMNEKFNKDEVWVHLGKSNKKDKEDGKASDEDDLQDEADDELNKIDVKQPVYNKDDFFDTLSCNALDHESQNGRPKFSEQLKIDTETFGNFSRYRGGRGGRGPSRGGGYSRGSYHGRGYGYNLYGHGYGYGGRGRGRGMPNRPS